MSVSRWMPGVQRILGSRWTPLWIALLAILVTLPTVRTGFVLDDFLQRDLIIGPKGSRDLSHALLNYFTFVTPETAPLLKQEGRYPWWAADDRRVAFFRPLSALTHWIDYRLWPDSSSAMHGHSILWFALLCGAAAVLYARVAPVAWMGGLAALIFTIDDAHLVAVQWIANRNAIIALAFGVVSLICFDRWRREGWRTGAWLSVLFFALSLLAGDAGVATGAYITAYALVLDRNTWSRRLLLIVPFVIVVVLWRLPYQYLGYGAYGSGLYVDPGREPIRFLSAVASNAPLLLHGQFGWPDPALATMIPQAARLQFWLLACALIAVVTAVFLPVLRRDRVARFWALGMVLALVPVCGMDRPGNRLLVFVGLGGMGVIAQFVGALLRPPDWLPRLRLWKLAAWSGFLAFVAVHLVLAPYLLLRSPGFETLQRDMEQKLDFGNPPDLGSKQVVVVNAPSPFYFNYLNSLRRFQGLEIPERVRILAPGFFDVELERLDSRTLMVRPKYGFEVPGGFVGDHARTAPPFGRIYAYQGLGRSHRTTPFHVGQTVELPGLTVRVEEVDGHGMATAARMEFSKPLNDPGVLWLRWDWPAERYVSLQPPPVGERTVVGGFF